MRVTCIVSFHFIVIVIRVHFGWGSNWIGSTLHYVTHLDGMLWMGDTVIDIDRLIVTVISTRGWMLDASNRLCWLAHCLLLACCALFSLASLRLLVSWAGQD